MSTPRKAPAPLLTTEEAAVLLGITKRSLEKLRGAGRGPQWTYVGRYPRYSRASINAYLSARARGARVS